MPKILSKENIYNNVLDSLKNSNAITNAKRKSPYKLFLDTPKVWNKSNKIELLYPIEENNKRKEIAKLKTLQIIELSDVKSHKIKPNDSKGVIFSQEFSDKQLILKALNSPQWDFWTVDALARETKIDVEQVIQQ